MTFGWQLYYRVRPESDIPGFPANDGDAVESVVLVTQSVVQRTANLRHSAQMRTAPKTKLVNPPIVFSCDHILNLRYV